MKAILEVFCWNSAGSGSNGGRKGSDKGSVKTIHRGFCVETHIFGQQSKVVYSV